VLATAHSALAHLTRLRDERTISAAASITYELVGLYRLVNEAKAAAHFSKVDLPLLLQPQAAPVRHPRISTRLDRTPAPCWFSVEAMMPTLVDTSTTRYQTAHVEN
jgi:hypothetical protein